MEIKSLYKSILLIGVGALNSFSILGQTKKLVITYPDSTIEFSITNKKPILIHNHEKYTWFKAGKIHITEGGYSGKLLDGDYRAFYISGQLKTAKTFSKGRLKKKTIFWDRKGKIIEPTIDTLQIK